MPRRQTSWFPQRGWCLRLSWPGTPVTSFRWGRVATIAVSPGGAAGPARRDAPRRSSGIPSVRTAAPGFRRGSTLPSSCHSVRADNRARTSSRTHLRLRARPLRVQTASLQVRPPALGTCIQLAIAYDGDIPRGRDSIPVPGRAGCPRAYRNVPARAGCPQPRRLSVGPPWHPEPLVQRVRRRRRPTRTARPPTGARSDQSGEGTGTPRDARVRQAGTADPHRSGWLTPIPAARRVRRGPPGAPGYGHRPAPAHCAGGP